MPAVSRETVLANLPDSADPAQLQHLHDLLATDAVEHGLIGPREAPRLWDRHIGNSLWPALPSAGLVAESCAVADVGSGAGLPGLVWAIARPDLTVTLIEPLLRRVAFLERVVDGLGLGGRVTVLRERAENLAPAQWDIATARAVAPLARLLGWTLPLVRPDGVVLALKGSSAPAEIASAGAVIGRLGAGRPTIVQCGPASAPDATRVVVVPRTASDRG